MQAQRVGAFRSCGGAGARHSRPSLVIASARPAVCASSQQPTCNGAFPQQQQLLLHRLASSPAPRPSRNVCTQAASGASLPVPAPAPSAGNSTFTQAVFNVVNVMMGVGLLSLPFALKSSGWVGLIVLWMMGIVTNYTGEPPRSSLRSGNTAPLPRSFDALPRVVPWKHGG